MFSIDRKTRCLIVEDDSFKLQDVSAHLKTILHDIDITTSDALSTSIKILNSLTFDIVIIDMSIPSHPKSSGAGSPFSFPSGGLDVLFEIEHLSNICMRVILTQYPEVEMDGELIPVEEAASAIFLKFGIRVDGCIQYVEDGQSWKVELDKIMRNYESTFA